MNSFFANNKNSFEVILSPITCKGLWGEQNTEFLHFEQKGMDNFFFIVSATDNLKRGTKVLRTEKEKNEKRQFRI